jgi:hypothetical protein
MWSRTDCLITGMAAGGAAAAGVSIEAEGLGADGEATHRCSRGDTEHRGRGGCGSAGVAAGALVIAASCAYASPTSWAFAPGPRFDLWRCGDDQKTTAPTRQPVPIGRRLLTWRRAFGPVAMARPVGVDVRDGCNLLRHGFACQRRPRERVIFDAYLAWGSPIVRPVSYFKTLEPCGPLRHPPRSGRLSRQGAPGSPCVFRRRAGRAPCKTGL